MQTKNILAVLVGTTLCALSSSLTFAFAPIYGVEKPVYIPAFKTTDYAEVTTGSSPDNSFQLFTSLIDSSRKHVRLAAYMLRSPGIAESLVNAAKRGVEVSILLDGWTVARPKAEKVDALELSLANEIVQAGGKVLYLKSNFGLRTDRRFRYLHAKYAVVDDTLFLSSENFANNGFSPTATVGSRGWVIAIKNQSLAEAYSQVFLDDIQPSKDFDDLVSYGQDPDYTFKPDAKIPAHDAADGTYHPNVGTTVKGTIELERVMSPDDATAPTRAILGAIHGAQETLDIQSLSFAPHWGKNGSTAQDDPSPLAEEVIAAARRGVKVRVMLNPLYFLSSQPKEKEPTKGGDDEDGGGSAPGAEGLWQSLAANWQDFSLLNLQGILTIAPPHKTVQTKDNAALISYFRDLAEKEHLDIQASFFHVAEDTLRILHNKGMIVDGTKTLISSINWTENSMKNNREAAVIVNNAEVARYYHDLFEIDWKSFRSQK